MTKRLPNLQVALDHSDLQGAIKAAVSVGHEVDVIEAGTVCLLQVGSELVEVLRSLFPDKIIVAAIIKQSKIILNISIFSFFLTLSTLLFTNYPSPLSHAYYCIYKKYN